MSQMENEHIYPDIVFDVAGNLFCVNSKHIDGIVQLPEYTVVPNAEGAVRGVMKYRNQTITLLDLRAAMGMGSLEDEYDTFCHMIDERKGDHERWVAALEATVQRGEPFRLATDPHKCALGKWRDAFSTDIPGVRHQLDRLDRPHAALHASAEEILSLQKKGPDPAAQAAIQVVFDRVKSSYMPEVLALLENLKHVFRGSVFREMVLLLNDRENFGVIVEQIHSVEHLVLIGGTEEINRFADYDYITAVMTREKTGGLIAQIDFMLFLDQMGL